MKIKTTTLVQKEIPETPKSTYQLTVNFDDADESIILTNDIDEISNLMDAYDAYKKGLRENWNKWCNPEPYQIKDLLQEFGVIGNDTDQYDIPDYGYWMWSEEYPDPMARFSSYTLTYWDENGLEWKTEVER